MAPPHTEWLHGADHPGQPASDPPISAIAGVWPAFHAVATGLAAGVPPLRPALPTPPALQRVCEQAAALRPDLPDREAEAFFDRHFRPQPIGPSRSGFVTGYYEPVVEGTLDHKPGFEAPILARPDDLVTFAADEPRPAALADYTAARRLDDGTLEPYPDRASIEADPGRYAPICWVRDWVEAFLIHVQGSARVRLPDGSHCRLTYAGRNGHPYTSIGRHLIETGEIAADDMSLERLKTWLRAAGQAPGERGRAVLQRNRSHIFFTRAAIEDGNKRGPIGGAGVPLTAGVSIAVDRSLWSYGLPFLIETAAAVPGFGPSPLNRLFVASDTGSAIVGPARADLYLGSGAEAGHHAGLIRHPATLSVLVPRA